MNLKQLTLPALLVFFSGGLWAQAPKYSNEFLAIGVGARALGMSNANVASVNDVTSGYWNPAGLLGVRSDMQIGLMHAEYFAGIAKYDFGAIAKPLDSTSAVGFSMIRFGVDNIPNTTELIDANGEWDYDRIYEFSAADYAFLFSYAKANLVPNLNLGANVKIIHRKVGNFAKAWGFGLDVGAHYQTGAWRLGAVARDITSTFNAWSFDLNETTREVFALTGNEIPENSVEATLPRLVLAVSRNVKLGKKFSLLAEADLQNTFDGKRNTLIRTHFASIDPSLGLEAGFKGIVFLRIGMGNIQKELDALGQQETTFQPNLGIGLNIKGVILDYALTDIGDQSAALYSNVFSLKFNLNKALL